MVGVGGWGKVGKWCLWVVGKGGEMMGVKGWWVEEEVEGEGGEMKGGGGGKGEVMRMEGRRIMGVGGVK